MYYWYLKILKFKSQMQPLNPPVYPGMNEFPNLLQNDKLLVKMPSLNVVTSDLQLALKYLTDHSLTHSAKWLDNLNLGLENC